MAACWQTVIPPGHVNRSCRLAPKRPQVRHCSASQPARRYWAAKLANLLANGLYPRVIAAFQAAVHHALDQGLETDEGVRGRKAPSVSPSFIEAMERLWGPTSGKHDGNAF